MVECPRSGAVRALLRVLGAYLARRGSVVVPTARAAGQGRLKIAFRGLYRSLPEGLGYERFWDIIEEIRGDERALGEMEALGLRLVREGGEWYLEAPLDLLEEVMRGLEC